MSRSRNYVFTHNNYTDTEIEDGLDCKYIIYGHEIGDNGTPHLQGYVQFANAKSFTKVKKLLPRHHIEVMRGTSTQAIEYCKKDGDFVERGDPPLDPSTGGDIERKRHRQAIMLGETGDLDTLKDEHPDLYLRYYDRFKRMKTFATETLDSLTHEWYWGDSGTGKSRKARDENPDAYLKMCNKWWDGYADEDIVIIEDFDKKHDVLVHHLKLWSDHYAFLAEVKGGTIKIRPRKIIVTSNYHPSHIWMENPDLQPILRRFKIVEFKSFLHL